MKEHKMIVTADISVSNRSDRDIVYVPDLESITQTIKSALCADDVKVRVIRVSSLGDQGEKEEFLWRIGKGYPLKS